MVTLRQLAAFLENRVRQLGDRSLISYGELVGELDLPPLTGPWPSHPLCKMFGDLDEQDELHHRAWRTAIVVSKDDLMPGTGFYDTLEKLRKIQCDSEQERLAVHLREFRNLIAYYS
jgi:hypothetical protein